MPSPDLQQPQTHRWTTGEIVRYCVIGGLTAVTVVSMPEYVDSIPFAANVAINVTLLTASLWAMRYRRKYPLAVAVPVVTVTSLVPSMYLVGSWAYVSLATQRRWKHTIPVGIWWLVIAVTLSVFGPEPLRADVSGIDGLSEFETMMMRAFTATVIFVLYFGMLTALGAYLGARRAERAAMEDQMMADQREAALAIEKSRADERARIAREMHDVLAHKISLISMHAGALAYREDLNPDETRRAAKTIEASSRQALAELRTILGQLRQFDGVAASKPQPTLDDLEGLIDEHRVAGRAVEVTVDLSGAPSGTVSRQAYRIVQEALTNAGKHAPGTLVRLKIKGDETNGISIEVSNPLSLARHVAQGAGLGLVGLQERVAMVGGTMQAGPGNDHFTVKVWLPW